MDKQSTTVEYRDVPGFPGYMVGSDGSVWSRWTNNGGKPALLGTKLKRLKTTPCGSGYPCVNIYRDGIMHNRTVHRLMLESFVCLRPNGQEARHLNDVKTDNRIENLRWGTRKENAADSKRNGKENPPRGSRQWLAKLTETDIPTIRARLSRGDTQRAIARDYGLSQPTIGSIKLGKTWRQH